ncbi:MAG: T9SS type A sorting domain-containing protein [Bacteroidetes bacterium]|nr:T9SS type A sorting domain-containing protein [Bacteroidota bacterium]
MRKSFTFLAACAFIAPSLKTLAQNKALKLNGSNYVVTNYKDVIPTDNNFTVELWVYIDANGLDGNIHQFLSEGAPGGLFSIGYDGADGTVIVGDLWGPTNYKLPTEQWTHLAVSVDVLSTSEAKLYVNGALRDSYYSSVNYVDYFRIGVQPDLSQIATAKIDELKIWSVVRPPFSVKTDLFSDPDPADPNLAAWYKMNSNSGNNVANSSTLRGSLLDGTINNDPGGANSWTSSPIQSGTNGLTFLGSEFDQVVVPYNSSYDQIGNGAGGTVEFWVNPSSLSGSWSTILGKYNHYSFLLSTTQIGIDNGTTINTLTLPPGDFSTGFPTNTWSHLAFVYNGTDHTDVYYNGLFLDVIPGTFGSPVANQPITLGVSKDLSNTDTRAFTGGIDEVRLWSSQQSDVAIFNNVNNTLTGLEANLLGQFTFDYGVADGDNSGMTVALDNTTNGNHGQLANFQMSGTSSNINSHTLNVVPLPVTLAKFTARKSGVEAVLQWQTASEQNSRDFTIERSSDGKSFSAIGVVAAAGNSSNLVDYSFTDNTPLDGSNYYRLKQRDLDEKFTYSPMRLVNFGATGKLFWHATGKHTVEVTLQQGNNENYSVSDVNGRVLTQGQLSYGKTTVSNLPAGVYFVRVISSTGGTATTKILIF